MRYTPDIEEVKEVVENILGYLYSKGVEVDFEEPLTTTNYFFIEIPNRNNTERIKVDISDIDWHNLTDEYWECYAYSKASDIFKEYFNN